MEIWDLINPAAVTILVALAALLVVQGVALLRRRTSQEQFAIIQRIAAQAVKMAEQLSEDNATKKQLAMDAASRWLEQYKIKLDLYMLESAVEAAVFSELKEHLLEAK